MLTDERKRLLLERLKREGRLVARDLSVELGLSEDTIRRDLREMAKEGLLTRVHGGALPASPTVASLGVRRSMAMVEKQQLGRAGARLIEPGQTVFIDGGTTNLELVRHLPLDLRATIVTHSPAIAAGLESHEQVDVILIGGSLLRHSMVSVGAVAHEAVSRFRADVFFLGLTGLHVDEGATTGNHEEAAIKRAIVGRSGDVVTLATPEKISAVSPYQICPLNQVTAIVVTGQQETQEFAAHGVKVIRAS